MASKPSDTVDWAAGGDIVEPGPSEKDAGFVGGEKPPAEYHNWLFNLLGLWSQYLGDLENNSLTWNVAQEFSKQVSLGGDLITTEAEAVTGHLARALAGSGVAAYTLLDTAGSIRIWAGSAATSPYVVTCNAKRSTDGLHKWQKITASQPAFALFFHRDRFVLASMPLAQNTDWTDALVVGAGTTSGWGRVMDLPSDPATDTTTQVNVARRSLVMSTVAGVERVLADEFIQTVIGAVRVYSGQDSAKPAYEISLNASYDSASGNWTRDVASQACIKLTLSNTDFHIQWKAAGTAGSTFSDAAWDSSLLHLFMQTAASGANHNNILGLENGQLRYAGTENGDSFDANPPAKSSLANVIAPKNTAKVWANVTSGSAPTVQDGFNLKAGADTVTVTYSGSDLELNFGTALADALYACLAQIVFSSTANMYTIQVQAKATTKVTVRVFKTVVATGVTTQVNLSANTDIVGIDLVIFGRQDT